MDVENQTANHTVLDIGRALIAARESKQLSAQDIASQMNLSLSVIEKIEANIFKQEIPLAFIRGYLRSYAAKVNADVETLSVEFDRQTELDGEPIQKLRVVSNFKASRREVNSNNYFFKLVTFLIVASLLGFAGWEVWKRYGVFNQNAATGLNTIPLDINSSNSELNLESEDKTFDDTTVDDTAIVEPDLSERSQVESPDEGVDESKSESDLQSDLSLGSAINETSQKNSVEPQQSVDEPDKPSVFFNDVSAVFTFTDNCWVQVTDANGQVLAIGEKKPGKVMTIKGVPPFSVILGDPSAVAIIFDNKNYNMSAFQPGRTAKFELGSSN